MNIATLDDISKENMFWNPGCAMSIYKAELSDLILEVLRKSIPQVQLHSVCCKHEPNIPVNSVIINNCAGCDRRFRSLYEGIKTISLWEVLDGIEDLELPDYNGLSMSVQDSCSYRERENEQEALRSILRKMNINIIESKYSKQNAICCGDSFYEQVSIEALHKLQKKRADQMPCQDVAVQCVTCIKSMFIGGKTPRYVPDLLFNQQTEKQTLDMVKYHDEVQAYIDEH